MQKVVKNPPIRVEGEIPESVPAFFQSNFEEVEVIEDVDEELVNIRDTDWYQEMQKNWNTGKSIRTYRENMGLTQHELAERVGATNRQVISKIERGKLPISKKIALALSELFNRPLERFLKD